MSQIMGIYVLNRGQHYVKFIIKEATKVHWCFMKWSLKIPYNNVENLLVRNRILNTFGNIVFI